MNVFEVPIRPGQAQRLTTTLSGVVYTLILGWNRASSCWILDVFDAAGTVPILCGLPLVTGADLLDQYLYTGIGSVGALVVMTIGFNESPDTVPGFDDLGLDGHLFYVVRDAV